MKRARDVHDRLISLLERLEVELVSNPDTVNIRKVKICFKLTL